MEKIWRKIKRYPKTYIVIVAIVSTILMINEGFGFTEKLKGNTILIIFSLLVFYFFVRIVIEEKINEKTK